MCNRFLGFVTQGRRQDFKGEGANCGWGFRPATQQAGWGVEGVLPTLGPIRKARRGGGGGVLYTRACTSGTI